MQDINAPFVQNLEFFNVKLCGT